MKLTLLGTSCAGSLPVYGCHCPACTRAAVDPAFARKPCSALIETEETRLLLDAGLLDLPERFPPGSLNGILLTHYHVDHVQGLFHWRWGKASRLPVYGPDDSEGCADLLKHPGFFDFSQKMTAFQGITFPGREALTVTPVPLNHSRPVLGYFFQTETAKLAYLTDTIGIPDDTASWLKANRVQTVVLDCTHPPTGAAPRNHNNLTMALAIQKILTPEKLILTHISHDLDCWLMEHPGALPDGVEVGMDGNRFEGTG